MIDSIGISINEVNNGVQLLWWFSFVGSKLGLLSVKNFLLFVIYVLFSYSSVTPRALCLSHCVRLLTQRLFTLKIAHHSAYFNNMKFSNSSSYHEILIQCLEDLVLKAKSAWWTSNHFFVLNQATFVTDCEQFSVLKHFPRGKFQLYSLAMAG